MRVNVYAEEMTDRLEIISKKIDGHKFTGLRFYLELPATVGGKQYQGAFMHRPGDDDSAAVTFWGKRDLRKVLKKALAMLDEHYGEPRVASSPSLVEALKFYADRNNYMPQEAFKSPLSGNYASNIQVNDNYGDRARAALARAERELKK